MEKPTAVWTGQKIVEAFPWDTAPKYLIRDRDGIFGGKFAHRVESMDIEQIPISARSPWQNPYVERLIGSIRRECLDRTIVFNEKHLRRVLKEYFKYYHACRTHLGLERDCPQPIPVGLPELAPLSSAPMVSGLHHRYFRQAAYLGSTIRVDCFRGIILPRFETEPLSTIPSFIESLRILVVGAASRVHSIWQITDLWQDGIFGRNNGSLRPHGWNPFRDTSVLEERLRKEYSLVRPHSSFGR
jgi:hypothetical protein